MDHPRGLVFRRPQAASSRRAAVYFCSAVLTYPIERLESLLDGMQAALAYRGGVTDRVVLDNTTIAVKQVLTGRDRVQTDAFQAFRGAYPFAAAFCAPAKGWEKGSVETGVKYVRNLVFRPRPTVAAALARDSPRLETVRLLLRQRAAGPRPAIRPVPTVRADLAQIAVSAPTLAAYDVLTGGRV